MDSSKFFYKWILPIGTIFCFYACIGSIIDSKFDLEDLIKVEGNILNHEYSESYTQYSKYNHMRLMLDNGGIYNVTSEWDNKFGEIENALKESSYAVIYHRKPHQTKWRFGKTGNICQLKIGTKMIYDIHKRQENSEKVSFLFGFFGIIGLTTLIIRRKNKK